MAVTDARRVASQHYAWAKRQQARDERAAEATAYAEIGGDPRDLTEEAQDTCPE